MLTTNVPGSGVASIHCPSGPSHLQPADGVLLQQRQVAVVLVRAHALVGDRVRAAGVADDLDVQRRLLVEPRVEVALLLAERGGQCPQDLAADPQRLVLPAQHDLAQLRQRRRPLVGPDQAHPVRVAGALDDGGPLGADVDLLAPVGRAAGVLGAGAGVATELGRVHVLDLQPLLDGQREELPGQLLDAIGDSGRDPVTGDVEEADVARCRAQLGQEGVALPRSGAEAGQIDDGQGVERRQGTAPIAPGGSTCGRRGCGCCGVVEPGLSAAPDGCWINPTPLSEHVSRQRRLPHTCVNDPPFPDSTPVAVPASPGAGYCRAPGADRPPTRVRHAAVGMRRGARR